MLILGLSLFAMGSSITYRRYLFDKREEEDWMLFLWMFIVFIILIISGEYQSCLAHLMSVNDIIN